MSRHRGGRKRLDKRIGRGHWKGRSGTRAAQLAAGKSNDARGVEIPGSNLSESKMRLWSATEASIAQARQARNQVSRAKRGHRNGYTLKPALPGRTPGTWHA